MNIVTSEIMREIDCLTIDGGHVKGFVLMDRAGTGATEEILKFTGILSSEHVKRFVIITGKGNNGGDGYVIARCLAQKNLSAAVMSICEIDDLQGDALEHAKLLPKEVLFEKISDRLNLHKGDIIIDCLLGTGLSSDVRDPYYSMIKQINESNLPVIALDIPSGLDGTEGVAHGIAVTADMTVTIGLPKSGFFKNDGPQYCGRLKVVDIGFPQNIINSQPASGRLIVPDDVRKILNRRPHNTHKYRCGYTVIVGGSKHYSGAPVLAAVAAMKGGAGMVAVIFPDCCSPAGPHSLIKIPAVSKKGAFCKGSVTELEGLDKADVFVIGPGMTGEESERHVVRDIFKSDKKIIADAGSLVHIAKEPELLNRGAETVLTPHAGELNRLLKTLGISRAGELAKKLGCYVVVKGQFSRFLTPSGDESINSSGCSTLASAGTGDVLAGLIGAIAAGHNDFKEAVEAALMVHGLAAEISLHGVSSTSAGDIANNIGSVLRQISPFA